VNDWLSIGGGVSAQWLALRSSVALPEFLVVNAPIPDASFYFRGDDWSWGYNFGFLIEADSMTRIGLTYRSEVNHRPKGSLTFTNDILGLVSGPATTYDLNLPATVGLSATHDYSSAWSISSDIQFTHWSTLDLVKVISANIPLTDLEHFKDSWMISVGAEYRPDDRFTWRGGVAWDQTPVVDEFRTAGIPDASRVMLSLGLGYRWSDTNTIDFGYSHYFSTEHASMNNSVNNTDGLAHAITLQGKYNNHLDYVAFSFRHKL
jgi:long-chain fatty acid transport protein